METNSFEEGTRKKIRFESTRGLLTIEDVWDFSIKQLNAMGRTIKKDLVLAKEEEFLEEEEFFEENESDVLTKLRYDIVLHIRNVKRAERKKNLEASKVKQNKEKILGLISEKQDEHLKSLSEEELQKRYDELG